MGSSSEENTKRLEVLYTKHHKWLVACAFNITKDRDTSDELVGELYLYLAERVNPSLWYLDSFNLMYLHSFLKTRFINKIKASKRLSTISPHYDEIDTPYDIDFDVKLDEAYDEVINELKAMEKTRAWASSKLAQLYWFNEDFTLDKLSKEIKISKSTAFLNVKKVKKHLKETIKNPFR